MIHNVQLELFEAHAYHLRYSYNFDHAVHDFIIVSFSGLILYQMVQYLNLAVL